jgi:SAM-dependent methyltransferase
MSTSTEYAYSAEGYCPVCEQKSVFSAVTPDLRRSLGCSSCEKGSIVRERALMHVLNKEFPQWRSLRIHESSPVWRTYALKLRAECKGYSCSYFRAHERLGETVGQFRNENLEALTFKSDSFDIIITLDVMEHVNHPDRVCQEVFRTLSNEGAYLFAVPTIPVLPKTRRRALYSDNGVEHLINPPQFHANPVDPEGSLVTWDYGYDFPDLIRLWANFDVTVYRFSDAYHGILGPMTEVYMCHKR